MYINFFFAVCIMKMKPVCLFNNKYLFTHPYKGKGDVGCLANYLFTMKKLGGLTYG